MILIISTCKEKLHEQEFVLPIENIVGENFVTKHYSEISDGDLRKAKKIIICGTSLKDCEFEKDLEKFEWLKKIEKPVLGICAGMQIIGLIFGGKEKKKTEIGFYFEDFKKEFLGLKGKQEVYHLHNNFVIFPTEFEIFCKSGSVVQAVKHETKDIYGVLFHPEVRQKKMILEFVKNG